MSFTSRQVGGFLALAGAILIGSMTLVPHPELIREAATNPITCLVCGEFGVVDVFLNVLLFIPLAIGLRLMGWPQLRAQVVLSTTSLIIELLQLKIIAGRDASLSDLITNSLGGLIGIWLADHWIGLLFPSATISRRLGLAAATLWLGIWTATAWLVEPSMPQTIWYGQIAAEDVLLDNFRGQVIDTRVNGRAIPSRRLPAADSGVIVDGFTGGHADVRARVVLGPPTLFPAPIVSIYDGLHNEITVLGQDRHDLIFRIRLGTGDRELHLPEIALPGVLATPGDTVEVAGGLDDGILWVESQHGPALERHAAALSPSWGWMFVMPWHYAMGSEGRFLTGLWVGGLLLAIAFWLARGTPAGRKTGLGILVVIVPLGLAALPPIAGFHAVDWSEWVAAALGVGAGWGLGQLSLARYPAAPR